MNKALIVILAAVTLDAVGIGLIFQILPALLREVTQTAEIATIFGMMLALYFGDAVPVLAGVGCAQRPLWPPAGAADLAGIMGFATQGWILFALGPLFALGGIGMPALQSLTTTQVDADNQGKLQGVLASLVSLAAPGRGWSGSSAPPSICWRCR